MVLKLWGPNNSFENRIKAIDSFPRKMDLVMKFFIPLQGFSDFLRLIHGLMY